MIQDTLCSIKFTNVESDLFILSLQENHIRLDRSCLNDKGKNHIKQLTGDRQRDIQGLIEIARKQGAGFSDYHWPKPGTNDKQLSVKIVFTSRFDPFNWLIGLSEYHDDIEALAEEIIIKEFTQTIENQNKSYYFVLKLHDIAGGDNFATMLINPNRPDLVGNQISDSYRDAIGQEFRKKFLKDLREKGESFVTYWYKKPGAPDPKRKLSYFKLFPEENWIVARGVYFDELDESIAQEKRVVRQAINHELSQLVFFLFVSVSITIILAFFFTKGITSILEKYKKTQKEQYKDLKRLNKALEKQATVDNLTGLNNKKVFNTQLQREIDRSQRYGTSLSLIFFDIDKFKQVNDVFGHLCGDNVLIELAGLIRTHIRESDFFARWGGEEFVILAPENSKDESVVFAEKLRQIIETYSFSIDCQLTCSFGVTDYFSGETGSYFINRADKALYAAKNTGRNRVVIG